MGRKLLKIKYKENFTLTSSSKMSLATISKTFCVFYSHTGTHLLFYLCLIHARKVMLVHIVTTESVLGVRGLYISDT
jgi:hypothetical protein